MRAITAAFPFFTETTITLNDLGFTDAVAQHRRAVEWSAPKSRRVVYGLTRALFHPNNRKALDGHPWPRIQREQALDGIGFQLHAGTALYWLKKGCSASRRCRISAAPRPPALPRRRAAFLHQLVVPDRRDIGLRVGGQVRLPGDEARDHGRIHRVRHVHLLAEQERPAGAVLLARLAPDRADPFDIRQRPGVALAREARLRGFIHIARRKSSGMYLAGNGAGLCAGHAFRRPRPACG